MGLKRLLVGAYTLFAIAAGARSAYQLAGAVELPYVLSGVAAVLYVVIAFALRVDRPVVLAVAASLELVGVLAVGAFGSSFPDETVWSGFGVGYGYLPLLLPVTALAYLWLTASRVQTPVRSRS